MLVHRKTQKRSAESSRLPQPKSKKIKRPAKVVEPKKIEDEAEEKYVPDLEVTEEHVAQCVSAIIQLDKQYDKKKALFSQENNPILLQVHSIKTPKVPSRRMRLTMPNQLVGPSDEIALFVADLARGRRRDHEPTIEHWEAELRKHGIDEIKHIIPVNQVKNEYSQFEMKRKLSRMYDIFLVDGRISGHLTHILGKAFNRPAVMTIPVHLSSPNLKKQIRTALTKTVIGIHGKGSCHTMRVGSISMPQEKIQENIMAAYEHLKKFYPGGLENIRCIHIKTRQSVAIPIYYSMKNRNSVARPVIAPKRPKAFEVAEGELSTISGDVTVRVAPGGEVKVIKKRQKREEGAASISDWKSEDTKSEIKLGDLNKNDDVKCDEQSNVEVEEQKLKKKIGDVVEDGTVKDDKKSKVQTKKSKLKTKLGSPMKAAKVKGNKKSQVEIKKLGELVKDDQVEGVKKSKVELKKPKSEIKLGNVLKNDEVEGDKSEVKDKKSKIKLGEAIEDKKMKGNKQSEIAVKKQKKVELKSEKLKEKSEPQLKEEQGIRKLKLVTSKIDVVPTSIKISVTKTNTIKKNQADKVKKTKKLVEKKN